MSRMQTYQNWRLEVDEDKILWLIFDKHNASVNTINKEVMEEFNTILDTINKNYKGVIICSGKKSGFIAGADISQFKQFKSIGESVSLLKHGQAIFAKLESLPIPTVAMIDGFCLGGGTEMVLACRYRIAEDGIKTRIGLPEVKLGIHPGWGGTVRLPRLIGATQGLNLILSGHTVTGKIAAKLGLVDEAVPKRHLKHAAKYYILNHCKPHKPSLLQEYSNSKPVRPFLAAYMRKKLREKISPMHYPAPFDAINNWESVGVESQEAYDQEAKTCGRLFFSDTCQNLVRDFFLQERLKNLGKDISFSPKHIHVIGAGTMGGDIAAWCALQGMTVTLQDREAKFIAPAIKRAFNLYKEKLKEKHLIQKAMDRLIPDINGTGVLRADVIIEAIFEDLSAKQTLFKMLEGQAKPDAILATNTSSIPLNEISSVMQRPDRLVGMHFFNPVAKMLLVEVVSSEQTDPAVTEKVIGFTRKLDKLPLPVKSSPGFLINRILMPYLLESVTLLDEGIPAEVIDKAMIHFGMPMGPIELTDTVGLDVCLSVANYLGKFLNAKVPQKLIDKVAANQLGKKTGEGFYKYKNGKPIKKKEIVSDKTLDEISDRLVLRMLGESFACLREGVVADSDLLDAGMVFGTGFAPFRGGPIHYAKSRGINDLFQQYVKLRQQHGEKTEQVEGWEERV